MNDRAVGVVGDSEVAGRLRDAGASVVTGTTDAVPETEHVVAVGRSAIRAVATAEADPLVVPVAAGSGVRGVDRESVPAALAAIETARIERHPVFAVRADGSTAGTAVFDVTVVTVEAARISAYAVETPSDTVGRFRADGVAVATPAGSPAYARRIGGPLLAPEAATGVVAPIAPFQTNPDHWVLSLDDLSVAVTRDDAPVGLYVDGDRAGTVARGEAVALERTGTLRCAVVDESISRFA